MSVVFAFGVVVWLGRAAVTYTRQAAAAERCETIAGHLWLAALYSMAAVVTLGAMFATDFDRVAVIRANVVGCVLTVVGFALQDRVARLGRNWWNRRRAGSPDYLDDPGGNSVA